MLVSISQHPWLFGILCLLPQGLVIAMARSGLNASGAKAENLAILYLASLALLSFSVGCFLFAGICILFEQHIVIPRMLAILCSVPSFTLFVSTVLNLLLRRKVGSPPSQRFNGWIASFACWICAPAVINFLWNTLATQPVANETFRVSLAELCKTYIPWFLFFWTPQFWFLTFFAWGMGGEMLRFESTLTDSISTIWRPLAQYPEIIRICLKNSLGLTAGVLVIWETLRCCSFVI